MSKNEETPSLMDLFKEAEASGDAVYAQNPNKEKNEEKRKNDYLFEHKRKNDPLQEKNFFLLRHHNDIYEKDLQRALDEQQIGFSDRPRLNIKFLQDVKGSMLWMGLLVLIMSGIFGYISLKEILVTLAPHETVTATVLNTSSYRCGKNNNSTCYRVNVSYVANDRNYLVTDNVSRDLYNTARYEGVVPVTYNLSNPNIMEAGVPVFELLDVLFTGIAVFSPLSYIYFSYYSYTRASALKNHGKLIIGNLTETNTTMHKGTMSLHVKYRFSSPDGTNIEGKQSHARNDLKGARLPAAGTPVIVVYDNDKNYKIL